MLTFGAEYVHDDVMDTIRAYHYVLDQTTGIFGAFFQSDWEIRKGITLLAGVKNLTNAYQNDFDSLRNRDSGYIYGPGAPRTFYLGLRVGSF